jgi:hypothetical protein
MESRVKLIVIYDTEDVFLTTKDINEKGEINFFEFDSFASRSIDNTARKDSKLKQSYLHIFEYLKTVKADKLAIILDLNLGGGAATEVISKDKEYDLFKTMTKGRDGAILAIAAIRNLGIKKLLIYISSTDLSAAYSKIEENSDEE